MDDWKTSFILGNPIFRGCVSLSEGIRYKQKGWTNNYPLGNESISHLGNRKIIDSKVPLKGDMLVSRRVMKNMFLASHDFMCMWMLYVKLFHETNLSLGNVSYEQMPHNFQTIMGVEQPNPSDNGI